MRIKSLMIPNPITITEDASITEAIEVMKVNSIRHLPVVSKGNILKGFVTQADLKLALIPSMLGGVTMSDLIIKNPITVHPDDDIEIAAQLIYKHKIGGMPVVKGGKLVGIITESDILRAFIDMMGILTASSRIDVVTEDNPEQLKKVLQIIKDHGIDVINVGMTTYMRRKRRCYFRLSPCKTEGLKRALEKEGFKVLDAMD